jgi:hypothetical protein
MELHGVTGKPYATPQIRRKLPAPFSRSRIDLDGGRRAKRDWKDVSVLHVKEGDTIANFGTVAHRVEFVNIPDRESFSSPAPEHPVWRVRFYNVVGDWKDYPGEQRVFAFVKESQPVDG